MAVAEKGLLQARLTNVLKVCPGAIVLVEALHLVHPSVLPVLINALSEQVQQFVLQQECRYV